MAMTSSSDAATRHLGGSSSVTSVVTSFAHGNIGSSLPHIPEERQAEALVALLSWQQHTPIASLGVTCALVCTYGCGDGRVWPTRCAVIDAGRDGRCRPRRACRTPPGAAGSARSTRAAGSEPGSPADPGGVHQPGTTPPSTTRPCGDASLAKWVGSGRVTVWHVSPIPPLDVATQEHNLTVRSFWKFISEIWKFSVEEQRTSNAVSISLWTTARLIDERS